MGKFDLLKEKYIKNGVGENTIEFAISSIKDNTPREYIIETLTKFHHGLSEEQANTLLNDLYKGNGGEYKYINRNGYYWGILCLLCGFGACFYIFYVFTYGGTLVKPILVTLTAILGPVSGIYCIYKAMKGEYREEHF